MLLLYEVYEILAENNLNSNLKSILSYNSETDCFGIMKNDVWEDIIPAGFNKKYIIYKNTTKPQIYVQHASYPNKWYWDGDILNFVFTNAGQGNMIDCYMTGYLNQGKKIRITSKVDESTYGAYVGAANTLNTGATFYNGKVLPKSTEYTTVEFDIDSIFSSGNPYISIISPYRSTTGTTHLWIKEISIV